MSEALLDTGVLVALIDRSERHHKRCEQAFAAFHGELLTSEAVLTEAQYLLADVHSGQDNCLDFFLAGGAILVPQSMASLRRAKSLMRTYHDTPMDFADATLVVLAEETGINTIFTLDRRGFETYRINRHRTFVILPDPGH